MATAAPVPSLPRDVRSGVLFAVAAGVCLGVTVPFAKRAFAPMPPLFAAGWVYVCGALAFVPFVLARPPVGARRIDRSDLRWILGAAAFGCVAAPYAYVRGLSLLPAHVVALLVNLEAVFGVLVAILCFRERLGWRRTAGVALLIVASVLTAALSTRGGDAAAGGASLAGVLWIAGACLAWAFDTNLLSPASHRDARAIVVVHNLAGGAAAFALHAAVGGRVLPPIEGGALVTGAAVGVVGYGLALWLILRALALLGAARTNALFLVTSAVVAVASSALVGGEALPPWIVGALALVVAGVRLLAADGPASRDERVSPGPTA